MNTAWLGLVPGVLLLAACGGGTSDANGQVPEDASATPLVISVDDVNGDERLGTERLGAADKCNVSAPDGKNPHTAIDRAEPAGEYFKGSNDQTDG